MFISSVINYSRKSDICQAFFDNVYAGAVEIPVSDTRTTLIVNELSVIDKERFLWYNS